MRRHVCLKSFLQQNTCKVALFLLCSSLHLHQPLFSRILRSPSSSPDHLPSCCHHYTAVPLYQSSMPCAGIDRASAPLLSLALFATMCLRRGRTWQVAETRGQEVEMRLQLREIAAHRSSRSHKSIATHPSVLWKRGRPSNQPTTPFRSRRQLHVHWPYHLFLRMAAAHSHGKHHSRSRVFGNGFETISTAFTLSRFLPVSSQAPVSLRKLLFHSSCCILVAHVMTSASSQSFWSQFGGLFHLSPSSSELPTRAL